MFISHPTSRLVSAKDVISQLPALTTRPATYGQATLPWRILSPLTVIIQNKFFSSIKMLLVMLFCHRKLTNITFNSGHSTKVTSRMANQDRQSADYRTMSSSQQGLSSEKEVNLNFILAIASRDLWQPKCGTQRHAVLEVMCTGEKSNFREGKASPSLAFSEGPCGHGASHQRGCGLCLLNC